MKRKYVTPSISIVGFSAENIVTVSNVQNVTESVRDFMKQQGGEQGEITIFDLKL